jgi:hypothetical protein
MAAAIVDSQPRTIDLLRQEAFNAASVTGSRRASKHGVLKGQAF